ncbi:MAG: hypothetical protein PHF23_01945 [Smithellaceae bacterium]|jgi:hypothetical protein|nr:hypothetical protein [Smithellaceae bacterium]
MPLREEYTEKILLFQWGRRTRELGNPGRFEKRLFLYDARRPSATTSFIGMTRQGRNPLLTSLSNVVGGYFKMNDRPLAPPPPPREGKGQEMLMV